MAVRKIVEIGDPVLRTPTEEVDPAGLLSHPVQQLIDDLIDTMRHAMGAGIAANQVGETMRIATIEVDDNRRYPYKPPIPLTVLVNPRLRVMHDETVVVNEGCLSVPLRGDLVRHVTIEVSYLDRTGTATTAVVRGLTAGTFQHEIDHLDGILVVDRIDPRTLSTWDQWERHGKDDFIERILPFVDRIGT